MIGFNDEALDFMLKKLAEDEQGVDLVFAKKVFNLALTYEIDFMVKAGVIDKDGNFTEVYFDEDDAFDFVIERIVNACPDLDEDDLAQMLEYYFEYHDAYMEEKGLVEWD